MRLLPVALPRRSTWFSSAAYCAESSAGGAAARNSSPEVNANGVTWVHCTSCATRYSGPVGRHLPMAVLPPSAIKLR